MVRPLLLEAQGTYGRRRGVVASRHSEEGTVLRMTWGQDGEDGEKETFGRTVGSLAKRTCEG